jgi:nucleotide-binding universal stress UspA family protein
MYYLPKGPENGRSPRTEDIGDRSGSQVSAAVGLAEAEHRREARSVAGADVSGERPIRDLGVSKATILVPVDGSKVSEDAVRHVVRLSTSGMAMKVHLLNVQEEWPPPRCEDEKRDGVALHIRAATKATQSARALLAGASLDFESHMRVGTVADAIVRFAREKRCHKIVMGTRRLGTIAGFVLGSVASSVIRLTTIPVTLVKET